MFNFKTVKICVRYTCLNSKYEISLKSNKSKQLFGPIVYIGGQITMFKSLLCFDLVWQSAGKRVSLDVKYEISLHSDNFK